MDIKLIVYKKTLQDSQKFELHEKLTTLQYVIFTIMGKYCIAQYFDMIKIDWWGTVG